MGIFGAAHGWGAKRPPLPKMCHRYPTMMKIGTVIPCLKKIRKIYELRDTHSEFCWHQHFFTGNQQILLYQEIQIQIAFWYIISNSFNFSWVFKDFFNKPGYNFDDVSKLTTPGFLKIAVFWNKGYGVISHADGITKNILSHDSNHIVGLFMWLKFGNCIISIRKVITTSIL